MVLFYFGLATSFAQVLDHEDYTIEEGDTLELILEKNAYTMNRLHLTKSMYARELAHWNPQISNWTDLRRDIGKKIAIEYNVSPFTPLTPAFSPPNRTYETALRETKPTKKIIKWKARPRLGSYYMSAGKDFNSSQKVDASISPNYLLAVDVVNSSTENYNITLSTQYRKLNNVSGFTLHPEWAGALEVMNRHHDRLALISQLEYEHSLNFALNNNAVEPSYQNILWLGLGANFRIRESSQYLPRGYIKLSYSAYSHGENFNPKGYRGDLLFTLITYNDLSLEGFASARRLKDTVNFTSFISGLNLTYLF